MVPKMNREQIEDFIEEVPYISDLQREFYKRYITARYEQILKPAWNLALSVCQEVSGPTMMF